MADLISRDAVVELLDAWKTTDRTLPYSAGYNTAVRDVIKAIQSQHVLPAVDAEPVRHGKWKLENNSFYTCSECGLDWVEMSYNYCPNCGAKMDGKDGAE